jgi:hypothetical protein
MTSLLREDTPVPIVRDRKPNRPGPDHEDLHSPLSAHVSTGSPT